MSAQAMMVHVGYHTNTCSYQIRRMSRRIARILDRWLHAHFGGHRDRDPLAGCGGGDGSESGGEPKVAGDADPGDVRVIDAWVTALRRGDVDAAARYFAIPSVAENGPLLRPDRDLDDARRFNESLPCGARLVRAETQGELTTATFRLTERPGPGICGPGTGEAARPRS